MIIEVCGERINVTALSFTLCGTDIKLVKNNTIVIEKLLAMDSTARLESLGQIEVDQFGLFKLEVSLSGNPTNTEAK